MATKLNFCFRGLIPMFSNTVSAKRAGAVFLFFLIFFLTHLSVDAQSRVPYAGKKIFINGMNVAWVHFAEDLGPAALDTATFRTIFSTVHKNGGNVMRLWLNTNGTGTPEYNSAGKVIGPGVDAISDLKTILNIAMQNKIGLQLCLWSHDMMNTSLPSAILTRNEKFFTDTAYTMSYIRNALIPMVEAAKGNPALLGWEVFNEPEGFSNELGWAGEELVPMADIQRVINLIAGAIHRTDPNALVTSGANSMQTLTDVNLISKTQAAAKINSLTTSQKDSLTNIFNTVNRTNLTPQDYVKYLLKISLLGNYNYYSNSRLIAAGGDSLGTLDYYNVHFYGLSLLLSPFNHSYSAWGLTKPLVIGEFFMENTLGVSYQNLYNQLYQTGYAGALSWQWWGDAPNTGSEDHTRTLQSLNYMFDHYPDEIIVFAKTGTIYSFNITPSVIGKGDSAIVSWNTEKGDTVTLNGIAEPAAGSISVSPSVTTLYTLKTKGEVSQNSSKLLTIQNTTGIINKHSLIKTYSLEQNYPNPFNPSTEIKYSLAKASDVKLTVYNVKGQKVVTLVNKQQSAGYHSVMFFADKFSSGVYFYILKAGSYIATRKMILLK